MINCFKSCFSPQQPKSSGINRNAFVPVGSDVNYIEHNQKTQKTSNVSPEAKSNKIDSDLIFTQILIPNESSLISDITVSPQNKKKKKNTEAIKQALLQQQRIALIKKSQKQRTTGNQCKHIDALEKEMKDLENKHSKTKLEELFEK
jgi:hypothetical protein